MWSITGLFIKLIFIKLIFLFWIKLKKSNKTCKIRCTKQKIILMMKNVLL